MAHRLKRPLVGVTGPRSRGNVAWWATRAALRRAGARAVRLRPTDDVPYLDAYIIGGGTDIEPARYSGGAANRTHDPQRDAFELEVFARATEIDSPILGICRGAQLINVARGGSLNPNLAETHGAQAVKRRLVATKLVDLERGSRLRDILRRPRIRVNALHRQGVKRIGRGLRVAGRDGDAIVQALEDPAARFVIGVQWHPEYLPLRDDSKRLFAALVEEARRAA